MAPQHPRPGRETFFVEIIKPSHYDDDGYVIQWLRGVYPPSSSHWRASTHWSCLREKMLHILRGDQVDVVVNVYDESNTVIPVPAIIRRVRAAHGRGLVLLAGVQTNQFPRAADLAREFRAAAIPVVVGGFHVSGCMAMLPDLPADLRALQEQGVALFAGEAEGRMEQLLSDAYHDRLRPVYNFVKDLPDLRGQEMPFLPAEAVSRSQSTVTFDAGRGCPFQCSFCTIINVQGRKSRYRDADDVERLVRTQLSEGITRFFITDDDLARNKNWEAIFDRLIALREREGWIHLKLMIQVDTQCHKVPRFIEKAVRAGCTRVFIGMESVNPENLAASRKHQNHVGEYRTMLQGWRSRGVLTQAGYILGFPADTPESIERDIRTIQRELPVDILEFFMLTPLPGSADHRDLYLAGKWLEPDMNRYDSEHAAAEHPRMSAAEWKASYDRAWHLYYSPEHVKTLFRRARAGGRPRRSSGGGDLHVLRQLSLREGPPAPVGGLPAQGPPHAPAGDAGRTPAPILPAAGLGDPLHLHKGGALLSLAESPAQAHRRRPGRGDVHRRGPGAGPAAAAARGRRAGRQSVGAHYQSANRQTHRGA